MSDVKWLREFSCFAGISKSFVLDGNINDTYPCLDQSRDMMMEHQIRAFFDQSKYITLFVDPIEGFCKEKNKRVVVNGADDPNKVLGANSRDPDIMSSCTQIIRNLLTKGEMPGPLKDVVGQRAVVVVVRLASRILSDAEHYTKDELKMFLNLYDAALNAKSATVIVDGNGQSAQNTLILLVDKQSDIPSWYYTNNPYLKTISVPNPDRSARAAVVGSYLKEHFPSEADRRKLVDMTDGMKLLELINMGQLFRSQESIQTVEQLVNMYRYGFPENPWVQYREVLRDKSPENGGTLKERFEVYVKGQGQAIDRICQALRRTAAGLSGLQHSSRNKPKLVFLLAGSTGTGKTECVKTCARILNNDENTIVRFDMSEYQADHSDQKLFGAPPGYVGYREGGQLTNQVRANPHAILLFDEIEKASSGIMNKFLQVLEDGRMTDGQGHTVSFSDTLIFFTTNAGADNLKDLGATSSYTERHEAVYQALQTSGKFSPEALGRIGKDNILVFNELGNNVAKQILASQLTRIAAVIAHEHSTTLHVSDTVSDWLLRKWTEDDKAKGEGGRGIGNIVESFYLNPLADFLSAQASSDGLKVDSDVLNDKIVFSIFRNRRC